MTLDEAFRLILMDDPSATMLTVRNALVAEGYEINATAMAVLWGRYRGLDGRTSPTHDYVTGGRLR